MVGKRKILFRADAGAEIGYGHFIRTLALADMLKDDFECIFYTQSPTEYQRKECENICRLVELPADDTRFQLFIDCLKGDEIVVLDNYFYTTEYQRQIKEKGCCLVFIDDMHDMHHVADLIINQAINVSPDDYSSEPYSRFALGMKYTILRRPFYEACKNEHISNEEGLRIVVAFGGSDFMDLTGKTIEGIVELNIISSITAIVGDSYSPKNMVENMKVTYLKNQSAQQIADLFSNCDVAILPSSTMMSEAMACGTTIIGGYYVLNQKNDYYVFSDANMILGVGDYSEPDVVEKIKKQLYGIVTKRSNTITADTPQRFLKLFKAL